MEVPGGKWGVAQEITKKGKKKEKGGREEEIVESRRFPRPNACASGSLVAREARYTAAGPKNFPRCRAAGKGHYGAAGVSDACVAVMRTILRRKVHVSDAGWPA